LAYLCYLKRMEAQLKNALWRQFSAAIDMLGNSIRACPPHLWNGPGQFWYWAYHTLFYLDFNLSENPDVFAPPAPYTFSEFDPGGEMPPEVYSMEQLLTYLEHGRNKCHELIMGLNSERVRLRFKTEYRDYDRLEIILYNMRHVQHHTGQLNLLLRQGGEAPPRWVSRGYES
jgi:hypothetical protein